MCPCMFSSVETFYCLSFIVLIFLFFRVSRVTWTVSVSPLHTATLQLALKMPYVGFVVMRYVQGITYITYYLHGCHEAGGRHHGKIQVLRKHLGSEELGHGLTNEYPSILILISHWCATSGQALRCLYKMG